MGTLVKVLLNSLKKEFERCEVLKISFKKIFIVI